MEQVVTKETPVFARFHGFFQWCGLCATAVVRRKNIGQNVFPSPEKKQEKGSLCLLIHGDGGIFAVLRGKIGWRWQTSCYKR
ncbi:hypothetical protein NB640_08450 [Oxalobacter vibrioformis]|uniref:Uncharacterized protein n=1 Tax=Oxalobacter vibrioformis TaxID=933080 RepID=A0A9E9LU98_9BURK|nr:hypothetical protein [Oxalobacter vibrioformis]NLC23501.1 hypothetical protein [Oxalobacter sp.]WAW09291.1 hypothetical protein NB640_08450 [Oxalobacter vibrioformis]